MILRNFIDQNLLNTIDMEESLFADDLPDFVVQPYQFEPVRNNAQHTDDFGSSSEDDLEQPTVMSQIPLPTDTNWLSITQIKFKNLLFMCLRKLTNTNKHKYNSLMYIGVNVATV